MREQTYIVYHMKFIHEDNIFNMHKFLVNFKIIIIQNILFTEEVLFKLMTRILKYTIH